MTEFILNNKKVATDLPKGTLLLDFIRNEQKLKGTKSACREGDCGSCTVLVGTLNNHRVDYKAITSCLTPIGNVHGKHVVTIEGLNTEKPTPIQQALIDTAAVQCGYCTPGFVVSLTAYVLSTTDFNFTEAKNAVAGNICRCTGYKSIERAIEVLVSQLEFDNKGCHLDYLINNQYVPAYFKDIFDKLNEISQPINNGSKQIVGGGTDLYVQKPDELTEQSHRYVIDDPNLHKIIITDNKISIGAACTISDLVDHHDLQKKIPGLKKITNLIASKLIRNIATVVGNLVNASPIGDLSILFLALNAELEIVSNDNTSRAIKLNTFFKAYKTINLSDNELIKSINIQLPKKGYLLNFEKVSKRKYLDIASVNSAISIETKDNKISNVHLSAGGVAPVPLYLEKTCNALIGRELDIELLKKATRILDEEISPISDVRGSESYKRLLARQLFLAHFIELFPEKFRLLEFSNW